MDPLTTTDTAAPATMAEPAQGQSENVYETALNNLDQILKATSEGKVQDGLAYLVVNFKNVYLELRKDQLETVQKLQELNRQLESSQAAVLNLSAQSTAHASLLGVHDGLLGNNKSVQGITKSYGGIL